MWDILYVKKYEKMWDRVVPFLRYYSTSFYCFAALFFLFCSAEFIGVFFSPLRLTEYLIFSCGGTAFYCLAAIFLFVLQRRIYCTTAHMFDVLQRNRCSISIVCR